MNLESTKRAGISFWKHPSALIDDNVLIGRDAKIHAFSQVLAHGHIGEESVIGHSCFIGRYAILGGRVKLKGHVTIGSGSLSKYVTLEDDVFIANGTVILTAPDTDQIREVQAVRLGEGCSIGPNVTICPGVEIGKGAIVRPNVVVNRSIPDYAIVGGGYETPQITGWKCHLCGRRWGSQPNEDKVPGGFCLQCMQPIGLNRNSRGA